MKPRNFRDQVNASGRNQCRSTRAYAGGRGEPTIQDPWVSSVPREIVITGPTQLPLITEQRYACLITFWSHALDSNNVLITSSLLEQVMDDADNFHRRKWEKVVHVPALIVHNRIV